jgi:hypothetical protein
MEATPSTAGCLVSLCASISSHLRAGAHIAHAVAVVHRGGHRSMTLVLQSTDELLCTHKALSIRASSAAASAAGVSHCMMEGSGLNQY